MRDTNLEVAACLDLQIVAGSQSINLSVYLMIFPLIGRLLFTDP